MPLTEDRVKHAIYLQEEIRKKDTLFDEETGVFNILNCRKLGDKAKRYNLREQIRWFSMAVGEMREDIFSLELASYRGEWLKELRTQAGVLDKIIGGLIKKEKIVNEQVEELQKEIDSVLLKQRTLYDEAQGLKEEYKFLLLSMDDDDVPEKLQEDYVYFRGEADEEYSDDNSIEGGEIIEEDEEKEPEEPEIKPFFLDDTCCACQEEKPEIFNIPCGHVCMCISCHNKNERKSKCSICRSEVKEHYEIKRS